MIPSRPLSMMELKMLVLITILTIAVITSQIEGAITDVLWMADSPWWSESFDYR